MRVVCKVLLARYAVGLCLWASQGNQSVRGRGNDRPNQLCKANLGHIWDSFCFCVAAIRASMREPGDRPATFDAFSFVCEW